MRWAGHIIHMGEMRNAYSIVVGNLKERDRLEDVGIDGEIILKWILGKVWEVVDWIHLAQDRDQ
jgi:hypothetical protein